MSLKLMLVLSLWSSLVILPSSGQATGQKFFNRKSTLDYHHPMSSPRNRVEPETSADSFTLKKVFEAIKKNPNLTANEKAIAAARYQAKAQAEDLKGPSLNFNFGITGTESNSGVPLHGYGASATVSVSQTVWDGGANNERIKAAWSSVKALEASMNSNNSYIENTRGALVNQVFHQYLQISSALSNIENTTRRIELMAILIDRTDDPNLKAILNNNMAALLTGFKGMQNNLENASKAFRFYVKMDVPENLEPIDSANEAMRETLGEYPDLASAVAIAKNNNQDYLAKKLGLDAVKYGTAAERARLTYPRVTVQAGHTRQGNRAEISPGVVVPTHGNSSYVGFSANWTFGAGRSSALKAGQENVSSAEDKLKSQEESLEYNIDFAMANIIQFDDQAEQYRKDWEKNIQQVEDFIRSRINTGSRLGKQDIDTILQILSSYDNNRYSYRSFLEASLSSRFNLEVLLGILLDDQPQPMQ
jgi:outer membrane protein TolC